VRNQDHGTIEATMTGRKWFVRSVVFSVLGGCLLGIVLYQRWTNNAAVRQQVLGTLRRMFPGASINVDSARLRILGGIQVNEIRLARRDDPTGVDFVHIPSAILYHDKEKILDGELSIRKVELFQPCLRLQRLPDGRWNFEGLAAPSKEKPSPPLPTLVVHHGNIILEERTEGTTSSIEMGEVFVTMVNDPVERIQIEGTASSAALGKLEMNGTIRRGDGRAEMHAVVERMPVNTKLLRRLAPFCPASAVNLAEVEGVLDVTADVRFHPEKTPSVAYDVACSVRKAKIQHPELPLPLDDLAADIRVRNGEVRLESLTARSGATLFRGKAIAMLPCPEQTFEAEVAIDHLNLTPAILARLPEKLKTLSQKYSPQGVLGLRVACARRDGRWAAQRKLKAGTPPTVAVLPEKAAGMFHKIPYPVNNVVGLIVHDLATDRSDIDLRGLAQGRPLSIKGYWQGEGINADGVIDIKAQTVPIDETLLGSLPPLTQKATREFNGAGWIDLEGQVRHRPGDDAIYHEFHVRLCQCSARWNVFPYPLEKIEGTVHIYPTRLEIRDFTASHNGASVKVHATMTSPDKFDSNHLDLRVDAKNVAVDDELREALREQPALGRAWENFQPAGRADFIVHIDRDSDQKDNIKVEVALAGADARPVFFPYALREVQGRIHYHKNRLNLMNFQARHGRTRIHFDQGYVDLHRGGYYANLKALTLRDLFADETLVQALPGKLQQLVKSIACPDALQLQTDLVLLQGPDAAASPDIYWDGKLSITNATMHLGIALTGVTGQLACIGRYNGRQLVGMKGNLDLRSATAFRQPLASLRSSFEVRNGAPDVLLVNLQADTFDGDITGQMRFEFHSAIRYELNLTASRINLQKFAAHNLGKDAEVSGDAFARLVLSGSSSSFETIDGHGSIDVPHGKLKTLPVLLDLIKFLGLRWPDRTAFEELHAQFSITGSKVSLRKLELLGNAISLTGKGDFNLDGTNLNVDFYPSWGRIEDLLPRAARPLTPGITRNLLIIEMRGKISSDSNDLKFTKRPMPVLVDPLLSLRDRLLQLPTPTLEPRREFPEETRQ
jgi:hypothetical protein